MSNEQLALEITKTYFLLSKKDDNLKESVEFTNYFMSYYRDILAQLNMGNNKKVNKIISGNNRIV